MESRNPVFNRSEAFSRRGYATFNEAPPATAGAARGHVQRPAATGVQTGRMTIDDVVIKTGLMFAVLVPFAAVNYFLEEPAAHLGRRDRRPGPRPGHLLQAVDQPGPDPGLRRARGPVRRRHQRRLEDQWDGIVAQAVLATLAVFAVALVAYKSGRVRATPKFQRTC